MSRWIARVQVSLKPVVNDPEGITIANALHQLGFGDVAAVRAGKFYEVEIEASTREQASSQVDAMCRRLLANPVIEDYRFSLARRPGQPASRSPT